MSATSQARLNGMLVQMSIYETFLAVKNSSADVSLDKVLGIMHPLDNTSLQFLYHLLFILVSSYKYVPGQTTVKEASFPASCRFRTHCSGTIPARDVSFKGRMIPKTWVRETSSWHPLDCSICSTRGQAKFCQRHFSSVSPSL
jgi:hypothetical protein